VRKHWRYGTTVLKHKWYVFVAGRRYGVPLWQLVVHDWSKFMPWEWMPYAEWFNGAPCPSGKWQDIDVREPNWAHGGLPVKKAARQRAFMRAFLYHCHLNPHHHQYWRLSGHGSQPEQVFEMPERYAREMVADWAGAGRAYTGKTDPRPWYAQNWGTMVLGPATRTFVERLMDYAPNQEGR
jgi:hypothetical protein